MIKPDKAQRAAAGMSRVRSRPKVKEEHLLQLNTLLTMTETLHGRSLIR